MAEPFVRYLIATGEILARGVGDIAIQAATATTAVTFDTIPEDDRFAVYCVVDNVTVPRPDLPVTVSATTIVANDVDAATISGFPAGAKVVVDGEEEIDVVGSLTITSAMPATYHLACRVWPYLDWEITVEAIAP